MIERAQLLINQQHYELAEQELAKVLAENPQDAVAHLLMAVCLQQTDRYKEATRAAQNAIQLQPENSRCHLIHGSIFFSRNRFDEAEAAVEEALRLAPDDEDNYGMMSQIKFQKKEWAEAQYFAEMGLEIDPDESTCQSILALSLERQGKGDIAVQTARESLSRNPDDPFTHATHGWSLLKNGEHKKAQEAFKEALRLDPNNEFAQSGMIQALNANNFLFRIALKWYTLMSRLSNKVQWMVILGLFFGQRILRALSEAIPFLKPFVFPIMFLYIAFCVITWIANPLFNTLLRFNRYGRYLLDKQQIMASNFLAGMLALGIILSIILFFTEPQAGWMAAALGMGYAVMMLLPISATFSCSPGMPFNVMATATCLLGLLGLGAIVLLTTAGPNIMIPAFIFGIIGSQFLGNYLASRTVQI